MRECRSYSSSKALTSLRRSCCMSVASGDTSSLPLVEKTARNTFTLLLLLLNYTINLDRRMRWTQLGSSDESRWIWITLQFPRQLPFPGPRNSLSLGRANNFPRNTIQAARHGVFAARSSVRCGRCCIAEVRGDRPARGKTVARLEAAEVVQVRVGPAHSTPWLTVRPHRDRLLLQRSWSGERGPPELGPGTARSSKHNLRRVDRSNEGLRNHTPRANEQRVHGESRAIRRRPAHILLFPIPARMQRSHLAAKRLPHSRVWPSPNDSPLAFPRCRLGEGATRSWALLPRGGRQFRGPP